jgi:hypothetical protein
MDSDKENKWLMGNIRKPWVARIEEITRNSNVSRVFVKPKTDYSGSNSKGSRGVNLVFIVECGIPYEAMRFTSWRSSERFFFCVNDRGDMIKKTKDEVLKWLS